MLTDVSTFIILLLSFITVSVLMVLVDKKVSKNQLRTCFLFTLTCQFICCSGLIAQVLLSNKLGIAPIYFDYFVYIGTCFLPVAILFTGLIFAKTKITFKRMHTILFVIPILSLILLWTNDFHHLFYEHYSININDGVVGPYFLVHSVFSYILLFAGLFYLLKFSIKNAGFFSKQSILLLLGTLVPLVVNLLGTLGLIKMTIYITPICFSITVLFYAIAIFKFKFLTTTPIALQRIVDRISDGYIVLNEDNKITDFNKTFVTMFRCKDAHVRNVNIFDLIRNSQYINLDISKLHQGLSIVRKTINTQSYEEYIKSLKKYFRIEISSLHNDKTFLGTLILFKDITQHIQDMETIQKNQESLMESERLASLGQLIGGIAHNLKTPIMSISGAVEGLSDLVKEYDSSIEDPEVNFQDHHEIASDMNGWLRKIKDYSEYMSDIITAVKGQTVTLSESQNVSFDLDELVKRVNILMKHELKHAITYLNVKMNVDKNTVINGDINSLVQVINNMISNSIQAYNGKKEQNIDLILNNFDNNLVISVKDYASGLPKKVQDKLFKEMITTKGKNGTGLGLYMSYSTIKAHFNGNITFETEENKGTTFNIILPL